MMKKINSSIEKIKNYIYKKTNNDPDIIFKEINLNKYKINIFFYESLTSSETINDFVLEFFDDKKNHRVKIKDIDSFIEKSLPINKVTKAEYYKDLFYNILSGFTIIHIEGRNYVFCVETKGKLYSSIEPTQSETVIKGPKDGFTENYQLNIGLIKKRIKSEKLWLEERKLGRYSQTKIGVLYVSDIASKELVDDILKKIDKIDIDAVFDSNYIIENISENVNNVFPTFISTERPDSVALSLLEGKIAIVIENTQYVIIIPTTFADLFHSAEDYYQKPINASYTRIVRFIALLITLLIPAFYIAITTYNHEAIPSKLLINFATQRDGVPFPTIMEALIMLVTFEILKETDTRLPTIIGSSLSIVGALVLGEAAVAAGIVSPIMVIVIAITAISGFILSYLDGINGIRWWRLFFIVFSSLAGILGIAIASFIFIINLSDMNSFGVPYLAPYEPLIKKDLGSSLILTKQKKYFKRKSYLSKNIIKGKEIKDEK